MSILGRLKKSAKESKAASDDKAVSSVDKDDAPTLYLDGDDIINNPSIISAEITSALKQQAQKMIRERGGRDGR